MVQLKTDAIKSVSRFAYYDLGFRELKYWLFKNFGEGYKTVSIGGFKCDFLSLTLLNTTDSTRSLENLE